MTWFDALLVTLLGGFTALGLKRGLAGGVWAIFTLAALLFINLFVAVPLLALVLAAVLGFVAAWAAQRLIDSPTTQFWQLGIGGLGGLLLGALLAASLALSFPISVVGNRGTYPSSNLPAAVYSAVYDSYIVSHLSGVWSGNRLLRLLLIPDQAR